MGGVEGGVETVWRLRGGKKKNRQVVHADGRLSTSPEKGTRSVSTRKVYVTVLRRKRETSGYDILELDGEVDTKCEKMYWLPKHVRPERSLGVIDRLPMDGLKPKQRRSRGMADPDDIAQSRDYELPCDVDVDVELFARPEDPDELSQMSDETELDYDSDSSMSECGDVDWDDDGLLDGETEDVRSLAIEDEALSNYWVVVWHAYDHAEYEAFGAHHLAEAKYESMYGGRWATRVYAPGGHCVAEYGSMSEACWQQLDGVVDDGAYCPY